MGFMDAQLNACGFGIESTASRFSSESPIGWTSTFWGSCHQDISFCHQSSRRVRLKCQNAPEGGREPHRVGPHICSHVYEYCFLMNRAEISAR